MRGGWSWERIFLFFILFYFWVGGWGGWAAFPAAPGPSGQPGRHADCSPSRQLRQRALPEAAAPGECRREKEGGRVGGCDPCWSFEEGGGTGTHSVLLGRAGGSSPPLTPFSASPLGWPRASSAHRLRRGGTHDAAPLQGRAVGGISAAPVRPGGVGGAPSTIPWGVTAAPGSFQGSYFGSDDLKALVLRFLQQ